MAELMLELVEHLGRELELYRELIAVADEERQILLEGRHQRLMGTAERKLDLCRSLGEAQKARRAVMTALVPGPDGPPRLSDLTRFLPQDKRSAYRAMVDELARLAQRLAGLNQTNKSFVEEALGMVESILGMLTSGGRPRGYGAKGKQNAPGAMPPRLVTREV